MAHTVVSPQVIWPETALDLICRSFSAVEMARDASADVSLAVVVVVVSRVCRRVRKVHSPLR